MSTDGHRNEWRRNIAENFSRLSIAHERYRQTDDRRQTDVRRHIALLKIEQKALLCYVDVDIILFIQCILQAPQVCCTRVHMHSLGSK